MAITNTAELTILLSLALLWSGVGGIATCNTLLDDCEDSVGPGSVCRDDGKCTVPELEKGCLQSFLPDWKKKRVCNSDDPPDAAERGMCEPSEFPYTEIRIFGGNWDSRLFQTWIAQIVLSEILGVPATVEGGTPDATLNFYDSSKPLNYGFQYNSDGSGAMKRGNSIRDCTAVNRDQESYEGCAHLVLEVWNAGVAEINADVYSGLYEAPTGVGMFGQEAIYVTKFTLENDTSLATYLGLQGEEKRQRLAEKFLRPTTWKDYCDEVSLNNCSIDDGVAKWYPQGDDEHDRMYMEGVFKGHFRATEENDCSLNNETFKCTGHIADYPCDWTSFVEPTMHHLGIALQSSGPELNSRGYTYQQLADMWLAANATKSNLMMYWWSPEPVYQQFIETDSEMIKVTFPVPTIECLNNRIQAKDTCHESKEVRIGSPLGTCGTPITSLMKLFVGSLEEISNNPEDPDAIHSPAYDMLRLFQMSEYQLSEIFKLLEIEPSSRKAVCRWAIENMDHLQTFVPKSYPRTIEEKKKHAMSYAAAFIALCVALLVCITVWEVHKEREQASIKLAQIDFLHLLLAGSFLISIGAILNGMKPTNFRCAAAIWFVNIGYTLELVPLIVKVAAICRIMSASQRMERAVLTRQKLYGAVVVILFCVLIYLAIWTGIDHPEKQIEYIVSGEENDVGETVIRTSYYCSSESATWEYVAVGWNVILLFIASIWAFQMRRTREVLNETGTLAMMIYSHLMFVLLRVVTLMLSEKVEQNILMHTRSLIFSADTVATIAIYFVPKFSAAKSIQTNLRTKSQHFRRQLGSRLSIPTISRMSVFSHSKRDTMTASSHLTNMELPPSSKDMSQEMQSKENNGSLTLMGVRFDSEPSPRADIKTNENQYFLNLGLTLETEGGKQMEDRMNDFELEHSVEEGFEDKETKILDICGDGPQEQTPLIGLNMEMEEMQQGNNADSHVAATAVVMMDLIRRHH